jgi:hypothetical protein
MLCCGWSPCPQHVSACLRHDSDGSDTSFMLNWCAAWRMQVADLLYKEPLQQAPNLPQQLAETARVQTAAAEERWG